MQVIAFALRHSLWKANRAEPTVANCRNNNNCGLKRKVAIKNHQNSAISKPFIFCNKIGWFCALCLNMSWKSQSWFGTPTSGSFEVHHFQKILAKNFFHKKCSTIGRFVKVDRTYKLSASLWSRPEIAGFSWGMIKVNSFTLINRQIKILFRDSGVFENEIPIWRVMPKILPRTLHLLLDW